jgi:hypothetical protein
MRVFYAHSKGTDDAVIDRSRAAIQAAVSEAVGDAVVVAGRDDFNERAAAEGGWKPWSWSVPHGTFGDGTARFDLLVVPDAVVGRATADMVQGFLDAGKPVMFWRGPGAGPAFAYVVAVEELGENSWVRHSRLLVQAADGSVYAADSLPPF